MHQDTGTCRLPQVLGRDGLSELSISPRFSIHVSLFIGINDDNPWSKLRVRSVFRHLYHITDYRKTKKYHCNAQPYSLVRCFVVLPEVIKSQGEKRTYGGSGTDYMYLGRKFYAGVIFGIPNISLISITPMITAIKESNAVETAFYPLPRWIFQTKIAM
jgi:hypothetical protein